MKFIAKTRIQHKSLVITIPKEIVEAMNLTMKHETNNFLEVNIEKIVRDLKNICSMKDCDLKAVISIYDPTGISHYCLKHYRIVKQSMRRKIKRRK